MADFPDTGGALSGILQGIQETQAAVDRISKQNRQTMLDRLEIQSKAPLGYQASFSTDLYGGIDASYVPVGMQDPRIQTAIASERAQAQARADAAAAQFHMELPDRLALVDRENGPRYADQLQQTISGISRDFFGVMKEGVRQQGENQRSQDKAQGDAAKQALAAEKEKNLRLAGIRTAALSALKLGQPEVAARIGLEGVKARGNRVKAAVETLLNAPKPAAKTKGFASGDAAAGAKILDASSKMLDEFHDEHVPSEEKQATLPPEEKAKIKSNILAKIDEQRGQVEDELRARFPQDPNAQAFYLSEFDKRASQYEADYTPPSATNANAEGPISPKEIADFIAKPENAKLIKDTISRLKSVASQSLKKEVTHARPRSAAALDSGIFDVAGGPFKESNYGDEAILQARQFVKLSDKRQFEALAHHFLRGTGPMGGAEDVPVESFQRQPPIPASGTRPR